MRPAVMQAAAVPSLSRLAAIPRWNGAAAARGVSSTAAAAAAATAAAAAARLAAPPPTPPTRRVLITGIGLVTPLAVGRDGTWRRLLAGHTGVAPLTAFDAAGLPTRFAAQIPRRAPGGAPPPGGLSDGELWPPPDGSGGAAGLPDFVRYALAAAAEALADAGLTVAPPPGRPAGGGATPTTTTATPPTAAAAAGAGATAGDRAPTRGDRVGVSVGVGLAPIPPITAAAATLASPRGYRRLSPRFVPSILPNMAAGHIAMAHGLRGPLGCPSTACAAGAHALMEAAAAVATGAADAMLAGGSEAALTPIAVAGFGRARALAGGGWNADPAASSRPFDARRGGFVMGEGAAVVVLEAADAAARRGVTRAYAELRGGGSSCDAHHITAPPVGGEGAFRAVAAALAAAGLVPADVDYINAHATGTVVGDAAEAAAMRRLCRGNDRVVMSSTKGATGHLLGAAGAAEAAVTALAVAHGVVPPTVNLEEVDVGGDGADGGDVWAADRFVPRTARRRAVDVAVSNSFGFGGTNASLVLGAVPPGLLGK